MTREGYRKHKLVIDWFYNQPKSATVLYKTKSDNYWAETDNPKFFYENEYLINDEYVEFRKAICEGRIVECVALNTGKWIPINSGNSDIVFNDPNMKFTRSIAAYRVKPEIKYPVFKRDDTMVVKFINDHTMVPVFVFNVNALRKCFGHNIDIKKDILNRERYGDINHTRWEDVLYDEERGLWDGQPILGWDKGCKTTRTLRFYDAKYKSSFDVDGSRCGNMYHYYEPYPHITDDWVINAYNKLNF